MYEKLFKYNAYAILIRKLFDNVKPRLFNYGYRLHVATGLLKVRRLQREASASTIHFTCVGASARLTIITWWLVDFTPFNYPHCAGALRGNITEEDRRKLALTWILTSTEVQCTASLVHQLTTNASIQTTTLPPGTLSTFSFFVRWSRDKLLMHRNICPIFFANATYQYNGHPTRNMPQKNIHTTNSKQKILNTPPTPHTHTYQKPPHNTKIRPNTQTL